MPKVATRSRRQDAARATVEAFPDLVCRVRANGELADPESARAHRLAREAPALLGALDEHLRIYAPRAVARQAPQSFLCRVSTRGWMRDYEARLVPCEGEALAIVRDVSDWTRTEEELQLFLGITLTVPEALDFKSALEVVMRMVCESTGWVLGQAWSATDPDDALLLRATWAAPGARVARFRAMSEGCTFGRGAGLPGRVWETGRAAWTLDLEGEPSTRRDAARADGLVTGFAVPVLADREVVAVLEFFACEAREEDARLLTTLSAVAEQLGSLLKQKHAEEALRLLESAVHQMSEALVLTSAGGEDEPPRIVFVGAAFTRLTGFAPEEAIGRSVEILRGPGSDEALLQAARERLASAEDVELETVCRRKDGALVPVEWRAAPVVDRSGRVTHVASVLRDITQRRNAEQTQAQLQKVLETAAQQWRETFDAIDAPILLLDAEGRVVRMNRASQRLSAADYRQQISRPLHAIGDAEPWRRAAEVVASTLREGSAVTAQVRDAASGKTWDIASTPLDFDGARRVIVVMHDITRVVQLQESLRKSEHMSALGSLVAGVAHEVRNPLHAISSTLDAFRARFGARDDHERYLQVLRGEVARLSALTRDLLDYGRPAQPAFVAVSLLEVVDQAITGCAARAAADEVEIVRDVPAEPPRIRMDPTRMEQVVRNLLENAIQHSRRGGRVLVSVRAGARAIECTVADEGPGFAPDDLRRAFEPFFSRRRGGTGLGLSVVSRIVEQHEGTIEAANRPEGGAVLSVRLPIITLEDES